MSTSVEERLSRLEERLERLESWVQVPADRPAPRPAKPVAAKAAPAPAPPKPRPEPLPRRDLEELLGGRLLALVGGVAVLVGLTFLVALAVERGWLDEKARTVLAFIGSALLLGLGAWLHENRGRTQASLAACGTGLAGLFLSLTAATVLYDLVPVGLALAAAFVFGAIGAALAVRWDATPIGGSGSSARCRRRSSRMRPTTRRRCSSSRSPRPQPSRCSCGAAGIGCAPARSRSCSSRSRTGPSPQILRSRAGSPCSRSSAR